MRVDDRRVGRLSVRGVPAPGREEPSSEAYRLQLWQVWEEPRWDEDDCDD